MSCADVCIDHGVDDPAEFLVESIVKARKPHKCCECGDAIQPGQKYERAAGKNDGAMWSYATCGPCAEIRKAFVCGGWYYGMLWESIADEMFYVWQRSGPIDCLAKLDTIEARDKCRTRYENWKER